MYGKLMGTVREIWTGNGCRQGMYEELMCTVCRE